jgi:hypothetical protein
MSNSRLILASRIAIVVVGVFGASVAVVSSLLSTRAPIQPNRVDGVYSNATCGSLMINNGIVRWKGSQAAYSLDIDKIGLFALPKYYVGLIGEGGRCHIVSDSKKYPLYLRFDDEIRPTAVNVMGVDPPQSYDFTRLPDRKNGR